MARHSYTARHRVPRRRATAVTTAAVLVVTGGGAVAVLPVLAPAANAVVAPSAVTDVNPNATPSPLFGGRVEKLVVDPLNPQKLWAGTELGGLWRTTNGGSGWTHVDAVPLARVQDVIVAAADPSLVFAVGTYDGSTVSQGGIWRSTDGGATWSKPAGSDRPGPCGSEASALSVAVGPGTPGALPVYVGDTCGLARSTSSGAGGTWTRLDPDGAFDNGLGSAHQWEDVEVRPGTGSNVQVDVCGPQGFFRSNDSGGTWSASDAASPTFRAATLPLVGNAFGPCSIAVSPNDANTVYLSNFAGGTTSGFCAGQLLENRNSGAAGSWTQMGNDVTDSNCRDTFVQTQDNPDSDATTYHVYFGTSTRILRQTCDSDNTPSCLTGAGNWPRWDTNTPHTDPTSIAFDPNSPTGCPLFHGADGGVFKETSSGCGATPTMAHANTGLHAFDSSQMAGTVSALKTDLYFGTQDNGTFYTADGGTTYINNGPDTYNVLADQRGNGAASIMRRDCFGCGVFRRAPDAVTAAPFTAPPAPWNADFGNEFAATQFAPQGYAMIVRDSPPDDGVPPAEAAPNWAVFYTTNAGTNWTKLGNNLPGAPSPGNGPGPGSHGQIKWSGPATSPTFFLTLGNVLYRLTGGVLDNTVATNTATLTNVSTGLNTVTAFDVDTSDPSLLFAVSLGGGQGVYKSINGGASWAKDNTVTSLVTGGGTYKWSSGTLGAQARSIGIDPYTDTVLVGTLSNGIYASPNNGASWLTVRGSKQIPFVLDYVFDDVRDTIYVGSRGRGLWRVDLPEADLSITKSDSPDPVIAGEQLKYTITVKNDGPDVASGASVVDDLPPQVSYVTSSIPCTVVPVSGHDRVTCDVVDLASGESQTFTMTVAVHADAVSLNGGPLTITNSATVASGETVDTDTSDNTATTTTVVNDSADLQVTKLCEPTTVKAGKDARCTIYVDNHGPSDARGVVLSDTLTSNGTFTVANIATPEGGTCAPVVVPGGTRYDCDLGVIKAESTANAGRKTLTYTVSAAEAQEIDNKARARSDTPDPDDTNNITQQTITVSAVADLVITKTAPATATAGTTFDYVLTVKNNGPSTATNVSISDTVPAGVTILTVSGTGGASCVAGVPGDPARPAKCTFGSLPGDGTTTRTMTISVRVDPGTTGILHNDARAASATFDPDTSNNLAHTDTTVLTSADLAVTKTDSPDPVTAGTTNTYVIHVTNAGPSVARNVVVDDTLPGWVTLTGTLIQHGSGTCALVVGTPSHVVCQLGDLNAGDYVDVIIGGLVKSGAPATVVLHNTVTVSSTTPDPGPGANSAFADSTVITRADLVVGHTSDALVYKPSTTIHYTITVTNNGPSDAVVVVIKDQLPPVKYGVYVSNDGGCTYASTVLTCPGVTLVAGATRIVLVNFFVQGSKGTIQATASVTSATYDPNTANNSLTRTVTRK